MHLFWVASEYLLHTIWEQCFEIWFYVMNDSFNFFECCTCMDTWMLCEIYSYYFLVKFRLGLQFCVIKQVLRWSRSIVFQQFIKVNTVALDFEGTYFSVLLSIWKKSVTVSSLCAWLESLMPKTLCTSVFGNTTHHAEVWKACNYLVCQSLLLFWVLFFCLSLVKVSPTCSAVQNILNVQH